MHVRAEVEREGRQFLHVEALEFGPHAGALVPIQLDLDASLVHPTDSTQFKQTAPRPPKTGFIILKSETELGYKPRSLGQALDHFGRRLGLPVAT